MLLALGAAAMTMATLILSEYAAIRAVSVRTFSVLLSLDAAIAALAGVLWLGHRLAASEVIGIALVVLASSGVMATRRGA